MSHDTSDDESDISSHDDNYNEQTNTVSLERNAPQQTLSSIRSTIYTCNPQGLGDSLSEQHPWSQDSIQYAVKSIERVVPGRELLRLEKAVVDLQQQLTNEGVEFSLTWDEKVHQLEMAKELRELPYMLQRPAEQDYLHRSAEDIVKDLCEDIESLCFIDRTADFAKSDTEASGSSSEDSEDDESARTADLRAGSSPGEPNGGHSTSNETADVTSIGYVVYTSKESAQDAATMMRLAALRRAVASLESILHSIPVQIPGHNSRQRTAYSTELALLRVETDSLARCVAVVQDQHENGRTNGDDQADAFRAHIEAAEKLHDVSARMTELRKRQHFEAPSPAKILGELRERVTKQQLEIDTLTNNRKADEAKINDLANRLSMLGG
ncbi:hypothetical protein LTR56_015232 [Elasticomyces elasticus]|nr:hypothetical protein LTR56_015232 [Elasticomyces elasticus]KAK3644305.1 hypothetical protein LTR22_015309 [Elasticomyces elasticus]KAK4908305.1 hypothetical protein LTR49_022785 [Elasticomyces elasticus]KAK5748332.1 hypothetical protein LTS12_021608 [Elasticomyces elasticus]